MPSAIHHYCITTYSTALHFWFLCLFAQSHQQLQSIQQIATTRINKTLNLHRHIRHQSADILQCMQKWNLSISWLHQFIGIFFSWHSLFTEKPNQRKVNFPSMPPSIQSLSSPISFIHFLYFTSKFMFNSVLICFCCNFLSLHTSFSFTIHPRADFVSLCVWFASCFVLSSWIAWEMPTKKSISILCIFVTASTVHQLNSIITKKTKQCTG